MTDLLNREQTFGHRAQTTFSEGLDQAHQVTVLLPTGAETLRIAAKELGITGANAHKLIESFSTEDGRWTAYHKPAFTPFIVLAGVAAAQGSRIEVDFVPQDNFEVEQSAVVGFQEAAKNNAQSALNGAANNLRNIFARAEDIETFASNFYKHTHNGKKTPASPLVVANKLDKINVSVSEPLGASVVRSFLLLGAAAELNQRQLVVS